MQNKEEKGDFVDCVGQLVAYCEKEGGKIPRFDISVPLDVIDKEIQDQKDYIKALIYEDKSLAQQIETYLKKRELADAEARKKLMERAGIKENQDLQVEDYLDKLDLIESEQKHDLAIQNNISDESEGDKNGFDGFDGTFREV